MIIDLPLYCAVNNYFKIQTIDEIERIWFWRVLKVYQDNTSSCVTNIRNLNWNALEMFKIKFWQILPLLNVYLFISIKRLKTANVNKSKKVYMLSSANCSNNQIWCSIKLYFLYFTDRLGLAHKCSNSLEINSENLIENKHFALKDLSNSTIISSLYHGL